MTTHRQLVHGRVDRSDHRLLHREAEVRGISLTRCVGDVIPRVFRASAGDAECHQGA